jgi:integrase
MLISALGEELLHLLQPQVAAGTLSSYRLSLLKYIEMMGDVEVPSVTPQNVELFKNRAGVKMKPNGVSIYFRALKSLWNRALKMGMITGENPFAKATGVKIPAHNITWITDEEHKAIQKAVKGKGLVGTESLRRLFTFLFYTGCRSGEAIALRVEDIDLIARVVTVNATKTNTVRNVPLNGAAYHAVTREINARGITAGQIWPYTVSGASHSFLDAKRAAGIVKHVTFYSYRHSFATRLLRKGVPISTVSKLLGHKNIATTMRFYAAFETEQFRGAVDLLD